MEFGVPWLVPNFLRAFECTDRVVDAAELIEHASGSRCERGAETRGEPLIACEIERTHELGIRIADSGHETQPGQAETGGVQAGAFRNGR